MKVILLSDIKKLGNKYDIKDVSDGYARNFLIPRRLAKQADKVSMQNIEVMKEAEKKKRDKELKMFQELTDKVDGQEIEIYMKTGKEGTLYGSISNAKIAEVLEEKGFNVKKEQIITGKPIKGVGEFDVTIKFAYGLEAKIKLIVKAEEK